MSVGAARVGSALVAPLVVLLCSALAAAQTPADSDAPASAEAAPPASETPPEGAAAPAADAPSTTSEPAPEPDPRDEAVFGTGSEDARDTDVFGDPEPGAGASEARDDAVFGAGDSGTVLGESTGQTEGAGVPAPSRDEAMLGDPDGSVELSGDAAPADPLTIGGLLYLRTQTFIQQGQAAKDWRVTVPTLAQVYLDVRPNERVRGFTQVRMQFDPTLPASPPDQLGAGGTLAPGGSTDGVQTLNSVFQTNTRDVRFVFDQLWLNFDIAYRAFVTVGKQHDRWGTGRFWMPTDYLHLQNRNPINVFDSRAGTNMLKLHVPIESLAWNFYAYAVMEDPLRATSSWGRVAGAARAEFVFGTAELGMGIFGRNGELPRLAADLSFGIWDIDFYGELAVRDASVVDRVRYEPDATIPPIEAPPSWQTPQEAQIAAVQQVVDAIYPVYQQDGMKTQVVGGLTYAARYDDDDVLTLGVEYFYNGLGYYDAQNYLGLLAPHTQPLNNPATFFYLGTHYLAGFLTLPAPFSLDLHTFTFSTLGNLADRSYISRIDYNYTLLTHLRLEAFVAVHYGTRKGEFRFETDPIDVGPEPIPGQPPSLVDLGLALRLEY